jgi:hypothetical protein
MYLAHISGDTVPLVYFREKFKLKVVNKYLNKNMFLMGLLRYEIIYTYFRPGVEIQSRRSANRPPPDLIVMPRKDFELCQIYVTYFP